MAVSALKYDDGAVVYDSDADTTAENDVFDGPVTTLRVHAFNDSGAVAYLKLYDALAPTVGTTEPVWVIMIPSGASLSRELDRAFTVGLSFACSDTAGKATGSNPGSNGVTVTLEAA